MGPQGQILRQQQVIATAVALSALGILAASWARAMAHPLGLGYATVLLALALTGALVLTYKFPIHIHLASKIYMGSVVLYLMAALLPPVVAATAIGVGTLAGELVVYANTHNPPRVITSQIGRWILIGLAGSMVAHVSGPTIPYVPLPLVAAGVVLWAGDILTGAFQFAPVLGISPFRALGLMVREGGMVEAAQYLVGLMGALEAAHQLWALVLLLVPTALVYVAFKHTKEMHTETRRILESMADMVDLRDPTTGGHSRRVTLLTEGILEELQKAGPEVGLIVSAARVHDIGKIGIHDDILQKAGKLTAEEWAIMQTHAERGADLLERYPDFARGIAIIRHHHESWDGTGYPHRLKGNDIPFGARVIAVADSFDAMTSDRPYRPGMTVHKAASILRAGRGQQWDGKIVDAFLRSIADRLDEHQVPHLRLVPDLMEDRDADASIPG